MPDSETHLRSFIKSITFRILATVTTIVLVIIFTGEVLLALGVGIAEVVSKLILYYVHERFWDRVSWGKIDAGGE
ncbi:MAG: DUF2061 domain-containing protein [Thermoplasmata archaeon]|nr:MAG: DUF2061 domain-containing protein [Thermoplasmata archaeon]